MCSPQALALLEEKIANNAHLLHEALRAAVIEDQSNEMISAVKQGVYYLQDISIAAGEANLQGLQAVCILSNQHLLQVVQQPDISQKQAACAALEYFPKLVADYLQEPHNHLNQQALIEHLQRREWPSPLPPESATLLADLLANDISKSLEMSQQMPLEEPTMTHQDFTSEPNERDLALAAELDAAFNPSPIEEIDTLLTEETVLETPFDNSTIHDFLSEEPLIEVPLEIPVDLTVSEESFDDFNFQEEPLEEISSETPADLAISENNIDNLFTDELFPQSSNVEDLAGFEDLSLDDPIDVFDENQIVDELLASTPDIPEAVEVHNVIENEAIVQPIENLDDLSWDDLAEEFNTQPVELSEEIPLAVEDENEFSFEALAEEITAETIVEQSFEQLTHDFDFKVTEEFPLQTLEPQDFSIESEAFTTALQEQQENQFIQEDALFQDNVFDEQSYAFLDEQILEENTTSILEETATEELSSLTLDTFEDIFPDTLAEDFAGEIKTQENELIINNQILKEVSPLAPISQPSKIVSEPQVILSLEETLINATPILQTSLETICTTHTETDLIQAVGNYSQQINAISQSIETSHVPALEETVLFIRENLHELAMSSLEERQQAQSVFTAFPELVFDYLHDQKNQAVTLVSFLQNPDWFAPLSEQEATELLAKLQPVQTEETTHISDIKLDAPILPAVAIIAGIGETVLQEETSQLDDLSELEEVPFDDLTALEQLQAEENLTEEAFKTPELEAFETEQVEENQLLVEDELEIDPFVIDASENELNEFEDETAFVDLFDALEIPETQNLELNQEDNLSPEELAELAELETFEAEQSKQDTLESNKVEKNQLPADSELESDPFAIDSLEEIQQDQEIIDSFETLETELQAFETNEEISNLETDSLSPEELTELAELEALEKAQTEQELLEENQLLVESELASDPFAMDSLDKLQQDQEIAELNELEETQLLADSELDNLQTAEIDPLETLETELQAFEENGETSELQTDGLSSEELAELAELEALEKAQAEQELLEENQLLADSELGSDPFAIDSLEEIQQDQDIAELNELEETQLLADSELDNLQTAENDPFEISEMELQTLEENAISDLETDDSLSPEELEELAELETLEKVQVEQELLEENQLLVENGEEIDPFAIDTSENELNALEDETVLVDPFDILETPETQNLELNHEDSLSPEELAELAELEAFETEQSAQDNLELNKAEENQQIASLEIDPFAISDSELDNLQTAEEVDPFAIDETVDIGNVELNQEIAPYDPFGDFDSPQSEVDPFDDFGATEVIQEQENEHNKLEEDSFVAVEEPLVEAIDPAVLLEPVNNALMSAFDDLTSATQRLVSADDDSEELLEAVGHYTEVFQPILDAAESNNLIGILEVGNFLNENVLAFGMLPKADRQNLQENLDLFPALLLDYLLAPQESAEGLIEHLKNPNWSAPLSEERAEEIKTTLLQIGQTPVEESSSFEPLLGFDDEPVELESTSGEIYLGKPEQIERVNAAIIESAEVLSTSLENFVSMQNDNELFLEAVDTYTTHVQNIWDAAEQAGLNGLQDVCNFVNENIMALSAEETDKRQLVHEQLDAWPMLILNYLTSPAENIAPLVELLQNPNWVMPLDDSQAELLTKALQQGSTKAEAPIEDPFADSFGTTESSAVEETVEEESTSDGGDEISLGNSEMLEMLSGEIESAQAELDEFLEKFVNTPNNKPEFTEISSNYNELVGRLAMAAEMVGLTGLQDVCQFVMSNVEILTEKSQADRQKSKNALQKWPGLVLAYLKAPTNNIVALLNHFRENDWPAPLPDEKAHALLNNLRSSSSVPEDDSSEPSRATQAKPEDVVLQIPEDVNQDLLAAYLQEAPQNAADFTACLQRIVKNPAPDDVKLGQRIAHTLKGSSNIIGIKGVATLAHNLEDILEYLFENAVPPPPALTKTMIEAADTLEIMIDSLQGKEEPPANALAILQEVLDWANRIDRNQLNVSDEEIAKRKAEIAAQASAAPKPAAPTGGGAAQAAAAAGAPAEAGEAEQFLRVPTRTVDNLLRLIGEMSISVGQIQERLKHVIHSTKSLNSQGLTVQHKGYELETLVVVRDVTNRRKHRLDDGRNIIAEDQQQAFDSLEFEQYNELHSLTHSFIESIADSRELGGSILEDLSALDGMFIHQERLNKEFQQIVMTTRMVPIKSIIARLERIVRQTCRSTEKLADLVMVGGDILIDGDVLTKLLDPLMHILRNSIDHGMELPADRVAAGKPETGTVTIRCYRQGNNIVVRCEDDGKGLNFERIRQIAVDRGLITENQELSPRELSRLILIPGFSTKGAVTQVSGRGVGMDVVHTSILELKGALEIESEPGRGSAMILILPMTLVTEHVLLVGVANQKFALPTHHLAQALTPDSGEFRRIGDSLNFHMDKNAYPVMTLADLLGLSGSTPASENDTRPLVLVKGEGNVNAVIVDYLYDSRNLVSKTMGRYVKKVRGVAGASILGDGSVVAMIDLPELLRQPAQSLMPLSSGEGSEGEASVMSGAPHIMIVDDSLSVRKVLSQLIEDQGFQPMLAKDGLEAVEQVSQRKPDVMLVDMEMPRMNGIELTAHIRANEATKHIPIFMITSRTTEKHRQLAKEAGVSAYLTKPYQDTELLGLINDALRNKR